MSANLLKTIFTTTAAVVALGLGSSLRADSISLTPGNSVSVTGSQTNPSDPRDPLTTLTGGTVVASNLASFTSGTVIGKVGTTVLSGVSENTLGGLTFVYELQNVSSATWDPAYDGEGITSFVLGGWDGFATNFSMGTSYFYASTNNPILPGYVDRSTGPDETISFGFPYDPSNPPIYNGEIGYQLILFTDAHAWTATDGTVFSNFFAAGNGFDSATVSTFTATAGGTGPTGVPDGATTAGLLGLSLLTLGAIKRSTKRA